MTKNQLRRSIEEYGNFMNVSEVAEYLGINRETARVRFLINLPYIKNGREKLYFKEDVVEAIFNNLSV